MKEVDKIGRSQPSAANCSKKSRHNQRPALVFENVKGFNIPVAAGVLGASRDIYAIGLEGNSVEGINRSGIMP